MPSVQIANDKKYEVIPDELNPAQQAVRNG